MEIEKVVSLLNSYGGRDKIVRTCYFCLLVVADKLKDRELAGKLMGAAAQLSTARMIGRRLGDLPNLQLNLQALAAPPASDRLSQLLQSVVPLIYQVFFPVEHMYWLCDLKLVNGDTGRWKSYCTWIWTVALSFGIAKTLRLYFRTIQARVNESHRLSRDDLKRLEEHEKEELFNLLMLLSDFMVAVNGLPKGILWAQTFPQWKVGAFGALASFLGLIKLYRNIRNK